MSAHSVTIIPHGQGDAQDSIIANEAFYPDLSTNEFRSSMRVGTTIPLMRVSHALVNAMIKVNKDLEPFQAANTAYASLDLIPAAILFDHSVLVHHYKTAVFNEAKARLTERYRDYDSTNSGSDQADKLEESINDYRQVARESIRSILGKPRASIKLL